MTAADFRQVDESRQQLFAYYNIDSNPKTELEDGFKQLGKSPKAADLAYHVDFSKEDAEENNLLECLYSKAKALIPSSLSDLQKRISEGYAAFKQFVEQDAPKGVEQGCLETLGKVCGQYVVLAVDECLTDLTTLRDLMNEAVAHLCGTGCFAWLKMVIYSLFYVRPIEKEIEKTKAVLEDYQALEAKRAEMAKNAPEKVWSAKKAEYAQRLKDLDGRVKTFTTKLSQPGRNPQHSDQDNSAALDQEVYNLVMEFNRLSRHLQQACNYDTPGIGDLFFRAAKLTTTLANREKLAADFQLVQTGIRKNDLSVIAEGQESEKRKDRCLISLSRADLSKLGESSFDFSSPQLELAAQMRALMADPDRTFHRDTPTRAYVEKVEILVKQIPQLRSPAVDNALARLDSVRAEEIEQYRKKTEEVLALNTAGDLVADAEANPKDTAKAFAQKVLSGPENAALIMVSMAQLNKGTSLAMAVRALAQCVKENPALAVRFLDAVAQKDPIFGAEVQAVLAQNESGAALRLAQERQKAVVIALPQEAAPVVQVKEEESAPVAKPKLGARIKAFFSKKPAKQ